MINQREELKEILNNRYGFLNENDLIKLEKMFGEDFNIIVRTFENGRLYLCIKEFKELDKEIYEDIRDVFLDRETYYELCKIAEINYN